MSRYSQYITQSFKAKTMTALTIGLQGSITALATFMLVNSITPGPNNLMLLHGGIKRGFWACRWHMLGITVGVTFMLWLSYWGMATLVVNHPSIMLVIKVLGTLYLLWLTYQMAKSDFTSVVNDALNRERLGMADKRQRFGELPLSFGQAVLFQWLNPKAWTMTMVAPSIAMMGVAVSLGKQDSTPWLDNWPLLLLSAVVNLSSISWWAAGGHWLRKLVHRPRIMKIIHGVIVLMTLYCGVSLWI